MPPNNEQSPEAREALRIAETFVFVSHPEVQCELAAALLEAEGRGLLRAIELPHLSAVRSEGLQRQREAQQLRGKGE
jgi:hypothetical protein